MKLGGMKTCGDYMFSGHTITMTIATLTAIECKLRPFINSHHKILKGAIKKNECLFKVAMRHQPLVSISFADTPSRYRLLHLALWLYCFCGMWAILASHGHYTLDVVVAFYISSRIFMYHQTFANNLTMMRRNRKRIKICFPVFYFFEKDTHRAVKNEYECPIPSIDSLRKFIKDRRVDFCLKQYTVFRHS